MLDKFDISLYDDSFFIWHTIHARAYSIRTMDWYIKKYNPKSVIDFGCGIGSYLESAHYHGLKVKGYEISEVAKRHTPEAIQEYIEYKDCTLPINAGVFDCVLSFETAEHIEPSGTHQFILNLVNATGNKLLFTGAPPGQLGTGHINLMPKEFWIESFSKYLKYNEEMTKFVSTEWLLLGCPEYIHKNLLIFER